MSDETRSTQEFIKTGDVIQEEKNSNEGRIQQTESFKDRKGIDPETKELPTTCCTIPITEGQNNIEVTICFIIFLIILFIIYYLKYYFKKSEHKIRKAIIDTIITVIVILIAFYGFIILSSPLAGKFSSFFSWF